MHILVADNNKTITKIVKMALEEEGYSVQVAHSPDEVLDLVDKSQFDIFILDTKFIRENDGYELVQKIKKKGIDGKFVLLVSALEKPDNELAKKLGIFAFLTKPVDSRKLFQIISELEDELKSEAKIKKKPKKTELDSYTYEMDENLIPEEEEEEEKGEVKLEEEKEKEEKIEEEEKMEGEIGISEVLEEKRDISFSWTEETTVSLRDELLSILNGIREVFLRVKEEAENYITEMRKDIKKKKEEIEKYMSAILSSGETKKLEEFILNYLEQKLDEKIKLAVERELSLIRKSLENEILNSIKKDLFDKVKELLKSQEDLFAQEFSQKLKELLQKAKEDYISELENFEKKLESKFQDLINEKIGEIKIEINEKIKEISNVVKKAEKRSPPEIYETADVFEGFSDEAERKSSELREEKESYGEVFESAEKVEDFASLENLRESKEKELKGEDFILVDEV
jgi:DNA-binding response OmpR family regulator